MDVQVSKNLDLYTLISHPSEILKCMQSENTFLREKEGFAPPKMQKCMFPIFIQWTPFLGKIN